MIKMGMTNVEFAQQYEVWRNLGRDASVTAFSDFIESQYNQARIDWLTKPFDAGSEFDIGYLRDVFAGHYDDEIQEWLDTPEAELEVADNDN